jgi:predicted nuclease of predicted toxin-antitoxin system
MRILLDECLPRKLKDELSDHDVTTVPEAGLAGATNGELFGFSTGQFDVFITVDTGLEHQQDLGQLPFAVIALKAPSNRIEALRPLMPRVRYELGRARRGAFIRVGE